MAPVRVMARVRRAVRAMLKSTSGRARGVVADADDVGGLHVPVDEPEGVGGPQRLGHAERHGDGVGAGEGAPSQPHGEVDALEPVHREPRVAVVGDPVAHVGHHGGARQLCEGAGLGAEALGEGGGVAALDFTATLRPVWRSVAR